MKQAKFTKFLTNFKPQFKSPLKSLLRVFLVVSLVVSLAFVNGGDAWAARSGGRMGGGSFSRPSMSRPMPRSYRPAPAYPGGGYGYGGGFGFPFLMPFFGFGGGFGGLFTILVVIAIANFLVSSFRKANDEGEGMFAATPAAPPVSVNAVSIGLLANGRELQADLNKIAKSANTSTSAGLALMLQETSLALLRHPEYWAYASSDSHQTKLEAAEVQFNRLVLTERSKVSQETLTNVRQEVKETALTSTTTANTSLTTVEPTGEYVVVTLVTATEGKVDLPKLNSEADVRQALNLLGAVASDKLMALEVLWQPQADGDTLSDQDLLVNFPNLRRL
jgi:uncharacterized membrane protein